MRKNVVTMSAAILAAAALIGCTSAPAKAGTYTPGVYSGEAKGFGGPVTVTVKVDSERILDVRAEGPNETPGVGGRAVETLSAAMLKAQSDDVDGVAGATISSNALKAALRDALEKAAGAAGRRKTAALSMNAGTYSAKAKGFGGNVVATVKVSGTRIEDIKLENEYIDNPLVDKTDFLSMYTASMNMETPQIFLGVSRLLPERVVKAQSLAVDAICGATATSKAALAAIADALKQAGADERALYTPVAKSRVSETYECDIVVVGGGTSGSSAAAQATELGAKVILVEKSARIGGSGALSTGPIALNSKTQLAWGQQGDADGVFHKFEELAHWYNKAGIFRKLLQKSGSTADWLAGYGFEWDPHGLSSHPGPFGVTGVSYKNDAIASMGVYNAFQNLVRKVDTVLTETTAKSILTDAGGKAIGITAERYDGAKIIVKAKAVIIATGGFGGNKKMLAERVGYPYTMFGCQQNVGEGFEMMLAAGAAVRNDSGTSCHLVGVPGVIGGFDEFDANIPYALLITPTLMQVNKRGERFASETVSEDNMLMGANYHAAQGERYFALICKPLMDKIAKSGTQATGMVGKPGTFSFHGQPIKADVPMPHIEAALEAAVAQGLAYKGSTIAELARNAGMDVPTLVANAARYDELCAGGADLDFNKKSEYMCALGETGPFYAIIGEPKIYGTLGSVDVDANAQVLRADGSPIDGLYAVGLESIGVLFDGVAYTEVGGVALGWGYNSGRIAAEHAAAQIK